MKHLRGIIKLTKVFIFIYKMSYIFICDGQTGLIIGAKKLSR